MHDFSNVLKAADAIKAHREIKELAGESAIINADSFADEPVPDESNSEYMRLRRNLAKAISALPDPDRRELLALIWFGRQAHMQDKFSIRASLAKFRKEAAGYQQNIPEYLASTPIADYLRRAYEYYQD